VPEVVDQGVTGWIVDSVADAVDAVRHVGVLDRAAVRQRLEHRFAVERMAQDYLMIYRKLPSEGVVRAAA
jgi:hypothetical protein